MYSKEFIKNHFKLHGFMLEPKAVIYLMDVISNLDDEKSDKIIDKMISDFMDLSLPNNRITIDIVKQSISVCRKDTSSLKLLQIIDAFHVPKLRFDSNAKKYAVEEVPKKIPFFSQLMSNDAVKKWEVFYNRYQIIYQRLVRDKSFIANNSLKPITNVLNSGSTIKNVIILGMLSQFQEGRWILEDETGIVKINLDKAKYGKGLIIEGSFVLAEGRYDDEMLFIDKIGMPPIESASISRAVIQDNVNYFGGSSEIGCVKKCKYINKLVETEIAATSIIFISEIFLDKEIVIQKLKMLFQGYESHKPDAFVLCGNFLSPSTMGMDLSEKLNLLKESIKTVIKSFAMLPAMALKSHLIFVPGPKDLFQGISGILPHSSLKASFFLDELIIPNYTESDYKLLKDRIIFTTSPSRMTFFDKEIVIYRDSIMQKLYSHCLNIPNEKDQLEISILENSLDESARSITMDNSELDTTNVKNTNFLEKNLIYTIFSQAHLMPLPIHISPVYWQFDNALQLFPIPDLLVLSDPDSSSFNTRLNDCTILNPFNFSNEGDFPFNVYFPYKGEVETCSINVGI